MGKVLLINLNLPLDVRVKKENLLVAIVIPGVNEPKLVNSFMYLLVMKFEKLHNSVPAIDRLTKEQFRLHGHITEASADQWAFAKVLQFKGLGSKKGCRICDLIGIVTFSPYSTTSIGKEVSISLFKI